MASFLTLNSSISSHHDNIRLDLSTNVCFMVLSHSMRSKYEVSDNTFYDVITNELYCVIFGSITLKCLCIENFEYTFLAKIEASVFPMHEGHIFCSYWRERCRN